MTDDPRDTLQRLCQERGESLAGLSRLLGRNDAYLQQYLRKGSPRRLPEAERRTLARYFAIPDSILGGPGIDLRSRPAHWWRSAAVRCVLRPGQARWQRIRWCGRISHSILGGCAD